MAYYLHHVSYSPAAIKSLIARPSDREAAARKLVEAAGGKLVHLFFAFGTSDAISLIKAPNDKVMMAISAAVSATGTAMSSSTTKLMSPEEAAEAFAIAAKAAASYRPPMA